MKTLEQFLALLFGAIVVGLVLTNARGVSDILKGLSTFTGETVKSFGSFAGRA